ncbi:MAG: maleylpyruvate isomerase family mycothiol-dependent enzyme [Acidimicrobiales bacterium]|jgi:uncharacterized protein (TIGR03083 family)
MDRTESLDLLDSEGRRILSLLDDAEVSSGASVPTCPDWTLDDLANHLGRIYAWVATILTSDPGGPPDQNGVPKRPDGQPADEWMRDRLKNILTLLRDVPEDDLRWNFVTGPSSPVSFWWRRQAHETLIHRVDAELAAGSQITDATPGAAADGIPEFLDLTRHTRVDPQDIQLGEGLTVHLHATDAATDAEWTIDTVHRSYAPAHLKADVALRGPAWALDRWCWRRGELDGDSQLSLGDALEAFGDWRAAEESRPRI